MLQIRLLGDFSLIYLGAPVPGITSARMQSLLSYLIFHRDAPQSRQHLAYLFWPDAIEEQARNNLRQLLHQLRHALPDAGQFLYADTSTVQWRPDASCSLDAADFALAWRGPMPRIAAMIGVLSAPHSRRRLRSTGAICFPVATTNGSCLNGTVCTSTTSARLQRSCCCWKGSVTTVPPSAVRAAGHSTIHSPKMPIARSCGCSRSPTTAPAPCESFTPVRGS